MFFHVEASRKRSSVGASHAICQQRSCWCTRVCRLSHAPCSPLRDPLTQIEVWRAARATVTLADITGSAVLEYRPPGILSPCRWAVPVSADPAALRG